MKAEAGCTCAEHALARQREALEREHHAAREASLRAVRARSQRLASLSHELRTPLHAVIGFLDLLGASSLTDKQRDHIGGAQTSAKHLLALVSDVLDAAKIESGALDLDRAPFEPASTVHDAVTVVQNTAHAKGLHVGTVIGPELRASFLGDALRTRQILINLLGNAVKFARTRVEVRARWIGETDAFTIEIEDDGPGIHPDQLARIFEPYRQADESTARTHGGTGLGLSIARDLARLMRGDITVRSEPAIGSTFCFSAPLLRAKASDVVPAIASPATAAGRLRILLADDDATNRLVGRELLGLLGHEVEVACDGAQAIERALAAPFDLLVLDVEMPALDGTEVTRRLRSAGSDVPVLGFTGHASAEQRQACLRAGMNGVVQKPADLARLATGIAGVVARGVPARATSDRDLASALAHTVGLPTPAIGHERSAILQSARAKLLAGHEPIRAGLAVKVPPPRPTSPDLRSGLDLGELERRVGGDRALFDDVLVAVREEAGRMFRELADASARRDLEAMRRISHTLKGCVANVGARPVVEAVVAVEVASKAGDPDRAADLVGAAVSRGESLLVALDACRPSGRQRAASAP